MRGRIRSIASEESWTSTASGTRGGYPHLSCSEQDATEALAKLLEAYGAKIADVTLDSVILELTEEQKTIDRIEDLMLHVGIKQLFRTGVTAICSQASKAH